MGAVIDTRQSYLDERGEIISAGRLVVYKFGTTELADLFQDPGLSLPLANPLGLSSASWTSTQVFAGESLTVLVQRYEGLDEFGQPIFSTVKTFDSMASASVSEGSSGSITVVNTVEDLRNINGMEDTQIALVKGYASASDCYVRKYIWSENSMAIDNGGTVISSLTSPTGRWILLFDGNTLDIRAFGVLPGSTDVNSQFRAACNWASPAKVTLTIPPGTYSLASSGTFDCYAALDVAEGVTFNRGTDLTSDSAEWFFLNLYNPRTLISSTFAGVSCHMTINGAGWENTVVPITAFNNTNCRGYSHGTGVFHLFFNETGKTYMWESTCEFSAVSMISGYTASQYVMPGSQVTVDHIEGWGTINFPQSNDVWFFRELDSSFINDRLSYCMVNTKEIVYLKTPVTLHTGADITAYVEASGLGTLNNTDATCKLRGGYGGKPNFIIANYGIDVGYSSVDYRYFSSANGMVRSWNASANATGVLDMGGKIATDTIDRYGKIYNGTVDGVTVNCELENVTVNGDVLGADLIAKFSTITGNVPNLTSSNLNNVSISGTGTVTCSYGVWNEVNIPNGNITSTGGVFRLTNVFVKAATFIPNSNKQFGNASWIGGSATGITFDASQMAVTGEAVAYNVAIQHIINLENNIKSVAGSTKKWAVNGHYNVRIGDNEGTYTRRTYGSVDGKVNNTASFTQRFWVNSSSIFYFPTSAAVSTRIENGSVGIVTGINKSFVAAPTFDGTYPNSWSMFGSSATIYLQFIQNFAGGVAAGDDCTIHFQLYK